MHAANDFWPSLTNIIIDQNMYKMSNYTLLIYLFYPKLWENLKLTEPKKLLCIFFLEQN